LYQAFEETRDLRLLKWGYAGLMTILTTLRSSGQATGWFTWWPDRTGFDTRSLDTDMGLYGYLMTAKAYVVDDPELGLCGYGCRIDNETENLLTVTPFDGVQQRLAVFTHWLELDISMQTGRIIKVDVDIPAKQITIRMKHCSDDYPPLVSASTGWGIIFGVFVVNM
ncbi:MAG: DUF5695 domain-containing protein, partial [Symbiobacteriaceae bacterium]|nr:DUF5695 domain-containing protein [Symbiobacteriaceae bacterium]